MYKPIIISILFIQIAIFGQDSLSLEASKSFRFIEFKLSNDFEYQTDYYYTNGFSFEVFTPWAKVNPINSILFPFNSSELELFSFNLIQDIFTPKHKFNVENQLDGDRPFAAYIQLGFNKATYDQTSRIRTHSEMQFGVLGPVALGEEVQNGIHNKLPSSKQVLGWENQIGNSLMINYSASVEKKFYINNWFEFSGISTAKFGLPFTNIDTGIRSRIGLIDSLPKDFELLSSKKWHLFLTLAASGSLVGYNATLQGGMFTESVYTLNEINRFVGYANIGLTVFYKKFKMEYVQNFITPEFPGAVYHSWGYLLIKFRF